MTTKTTNSRTGETTITNDTTGNFVVYGPDADGSGYNLAGYSADGDGPHWQDFTETEDEAVATAERMLA